MRTFAAFFRNHHTDKQSDMRFVKDYIGIALVSIGVLMLVGMHAVHVTFINWLLLTALLFIGAGTTLHVWRQKQT